ncbi:MAG: hypothetical protein IIU31_01445, partial [Pseudobutyrivibrio sp.]|nr:hypothetical protein [Pseudobutyrivibrio sp.]
MKGVKGRIVSVALCSAMAFTTVGNDVSMIANAEGLQQDENVFPVTAEEDTAEENEEKEEAVEQTEEVEEAAEKEEGDEEESEEELEEESEEVEVQLKEEKEEEESDEVKLIASFDFDDEESGFSGAGAKAENHGVTVEDTDLIKNVAHFDGKSDYLDVKKADGSSLLTGEEEFTISYLRQVDGGTDWTFFAAPNTDRQVYRSEKYIGVLDSGSSKLVERYNSDDQDRPSQLTAKGGSKKWEMVTVVVGKNGTSVFVNGDNVGSKSDYSHDIDVKKLLGDSSILQIGKGNWGTGEFFEGYIDDYNIYSGAMTTEQVKELYELKKDKLVEKVEVIDDELQADYDALEIYNASDIRGNITLPSEGKYGSKITWKSDNTDVITDKPSSNDGYADTPAGVVKRGTSDEKVKLTATLSFDGEEKTKEFEVTVKALKKQEKTTDYLFAYFTGNTVSGENIYFATSQDGFNYDELNGGEYVLTSEKGEKGLRDPYIMRSHEGDKFYMIATDLSIGRNGDWGRAQNAGSQAIMVWESTDLINWSKQRMVTITDSIDAGCTW